MNDFEHLLLTFVEDKIQALSSDLIGCLETEEKKKKNSIARL